MIASLRGTVREKTAERVVIECSGVGFDVAMSAKTAAALPPEGEEVSLFVHTHAVKDGGIELYGFADRSERAAFELLIGVQGVGPRVALQVLGGIGAAELAEAIRRKDTTRLMALRGVGKRIAERLVTELQGRVDALMSAQPQASSPMPEGATVPSQLSERVAQALVALGYKQSQAERAAQAAVGIRGEAPLDELVREALRWTEVPR